MRTRNQVNAWREATAQHRRDTAAFVAAIAASRQAHEQAVAATPPAATPDAKTRKRKLASPSSASATSPASPPLPREVAAATAEPAEISPAVRDAKRRSVVRSDKAPNKPAAHKPTPKAARIRRTLDYADVVAPERTARDVLARVASGDSDVGSPLVVGRDVERREIERVVGGAPDNTARALFVVGPPGTGKSSCVAEVAARATATVVRVNCSTFASPVALHGAVRDQLATALPALDDPQQLDAFLADPPAGSDCVLVLDEVDHLVRLSSAVLRAKAQRLLAFLVRWAHVPSGPLRVVGILNGADMHAQISEFLAHVPHPTQVVVFPSYSLGELAAILEGTVRAAMGATTSVAVDEIVEPRALELIARKIAARDGDARRAVGLLRQCARVALASPPAAGSETDHPTRIGVRDVLKCTSAAIASQLSVAKQIQQLPRAPKVLLYTVTRLAAACEAATATLEDVLAEIETLRDTQPSLAWLPRFRPDELQQHLGALDCYALVKQTPAKSKSAWHAKLASTVAMDALARAFQDDELLALLPTSTAH